MHLEITVALSYRTINKYNCQIATYATHAQQKISQYAQKCIFCA